MGANGMNGTFSQAGGRADSGLGERGEAGAYSRESITGVVLEELARATPTPRLQSLTPGSSLAENGIDTVRFMDAVTCLEGRYQMRFREEWLRGIDTCGDLIECVSRRMFDDADRTAHVTVRTATQARVSAAPVHEADQHPAESMKFPECAALEERLAGLESAGLENPFLLANEEVRGRTSRIGGRDVVSFTSFDYLGLACHPDVTRAAKAAIDRFGCSASASRMVGGNNTILDELDAELAAFIGTERAVVFPCGYGTNASVFNHLFGAGDLILYDELAHNSIMQGAGASKAGKRSFRHNDPDQLDRLLRDLRPQYQRIVVAIEGVYSMDGDYPDLPKFIEVKKRHDALLYVDEAHSLGTMGPGGASVTSSEWMRGRAISGWAPSARRWGPAAAISPEESGSFNISATPRRLSCFRPPARRQTPRRHWRGCG